MLHQALHGCRGVGPGRHREIKVREEVDRVAQGQRGSFILVTGGARSGKSSYAEKTAAASGKKVIYIATATGDDQEMRERIKNHRSRRPAGFITVEEPFEPHRIVEKEDHGETFFLLDCLTLLLSNHLLRGDDGSASGESYGKRAEKFLVEMERLAAVLRDSAATALLVTNEVGMGIVPDSALSRIFRDTAGRANQLAAAAADRVWLIACGLPLALK
ncbi:MAG: bifunctional adenosylcobinamide kinase/adenosylcobinamide-phosphate guanylyltransferase [Bacillota bacterium]